MIDSRRWPRHTPSSSKTPSSSGPRWRMASSMRGIAARDSSAGWPTMPATAHTQPTSRCVCPCPRLAAVAHPVLADHHLLTKLRVSVDHRGRNGVMMSSMTSWPGIRRCVRGGGGDGRARRSGSQPVARGGGGGGRVRQLGLRPTACGDGDGGRACWSGSRPVARGDGGASAPRLLVRHECQSRRGENCEQGHAESVGHSPVHRGHLAGPTATRAYNSFNTVGASPGKSSLTRPGPKPSAQAA